MSEEEKFHKEYNGLNTWNLMRKLDDPEIQKDLDIVELSALKNKNLKYNKDIGAFTDSYGTKVKSAMEAYKQNLEIRKKASKFLTNKKDLNDFMSAPNWEAYEERSKPFESALNNVQKNKVKPKVTPVVKPYEMPEPDPLYVNLIINRDNNKIIPEPNFQSAPDPDLTKGLGSLIRTKDK